jgi:hypothetical protein
MRLLYLEAVKARLVNRKIIRDTQARYCLGGGAEVPFYLLNTSTGERLMSDVYGDAEHAYKQVLEQVGGAL